MSKKLSDTQKNFEAVEVLGQFKNYRTFLDRSGDVDLTINVHEPGAREFIKNFDQFEIMKIIFIKAPEYEDCLDMNDAVGTRNCNGEPLSDEQILKYAHWKELKRDLVNGLVSK